METKVTAFPRYLPFQNKDKITDVVENDSIPAITQPTKEVK